MSPLAGRARRLTACLLAALAWLTPMEAFTQDTGELPEQLRLIAGVKFQGRKHLSRRELKDANLKTRSPSRLPWRDRPSLRLDYLRADTAAIAGLYRHHGFLDARVHWELKPTRDPEAARVVFVIEEGKRSKVGRLELNGVQEFHDREVRKELLARPGRAYDPAFLALDTLTISRIYQERGYRPHTVASAERDSVDPVAVTLRYDVQEGPRFLIGRIDIESSGRLKESLALREMWLKPGDVYRRSRLERSVERLYDTGLYSQVQVSSFADTSTSTLDLLVRVSERRSRWVDVGVGSGTADPFRFTGSWGHRNLNHNALLGSLTADLAIDRQRRDAQSESQALVVRHGRGSANLVEPWLFNFRLRGQFSVFYEEVRDDRDPRFLQHRDSRGVQVGLAREFSRIFRGGVTAYGALVHQSYDIFLDTDQATRDSLAQVLPRYYDNGIGVSLTRDTRDDRIAPSRGSQQTLVTDVAGGPLKGTSSYAKAQLASISYSPRSNGWNLAIRWSGGVMTPTGDPPDDFSPGLQDEKVARTPKERRFFLGGVNTLRGWGENSIPADGGLAMLLANLEMRIPLKGPFWAEVYLDAGNVWPRAEHIRIADFVAPWNSRQGGDGDLRYSYGVGARLLLPFGPLRMDLTWSRHPDFVGSEAFGKQRAFAYQFAIGPSF